MPDEATSVAEEFHFVYQLMDGNWRDFDTIGGRLMVFPTLGEVESVARHIVSIDGIVGGLVVNQEDRIVQRWQAPRKGPAELVEGEAEDAVTLCQ